MELQLTPSINVYPYSSQIILAMLKGVVFVCIIKKIYLWE